MDGGETEVVVKLRRPRTERSAGRRRQVRWSVADFRGEPSGEGRQRQSICLTGGFSSLSPAKTGPVQPPSKETGGKKKKWRHSYTCGDETSVVLVSARNVATESVLYSIREEESPALTAVHKKGQERRRSQVARPPGIAQAPHLALFSPLS